MIYFNIRLVFLLSSLLLITCKNKKELLVNSTNSKIKYSGRIDTSHVDKIDLHWSGTSLEINFEGESIFALIEDEMGDNYYNVIIDGKVSNVLKPDTKKKYYELAKGLNNGKHTLQLFKRTEWDRGKTSFYGFKIVGNAKVLSRSSPTNRKIEFYGNSITAGYAIEDISGSDSSDGKYINNYLSYAAITARYFDAEYRCIAKSGIGMMVSWFPLIMPEMYDRLVPSDSNSKWNFAAYQPDIVVVNLFQNDSWIVEMPESVEFKNRFDKSMPDDEFIINAYQQFITQIRSHYPETTIICTLGCMDAAKEGSKWIQYISKAIENINDTSIYTYFMPYIEASAHPSIEDHRQMADGLINFIESNISW